MWSGWVGVVWVGRCGLGRGGLRVCGLGRGGLGGVSEQVGVL